MGVKRIIINQLLKILPEGMKGKRLTKTPVIIKILSLAILLLL
jgi:hypothetical protein